jgi:predicted metalloprotease with PDZ domain
LLVLLAVCAVLAAGADSPAPSTADPSDPVSTLIQQLHSPRYAVRETATLELLRLSADHRPAIEQALAHESDPEAAMRLQRAAVHLLMKARTPIGGDIGVLGISLMIEAVQLDPRRPNVQMTVVVIKTQPGFPAAEVLEPCDRILGINGERFTLQTSADDFRRKINDTPPGTVMQVSVLRDGKILELPVRVAGLRTEDAPLLMSIVQQRDALITSYTESLVDGSKSKPLVIRDESGASDNERRSEGVLPAIAPNNP